MNLIHSTKNKNKKKSFCIDNEYENQLSTKNGSHLGNCSNKYKMTCALSNTSIKIIITQNICNIFKQIFLVENRFSIPFYSFMFSPKFIHFTVKRYFLAKRQSCDKKKCAP